MNRCDALLHLQRNETKDRAKEELRTFMLRSFASLNTWPCFYRGARIRQARGDHDPRARRHRKALIEGTDAVRIRARSAVGVHAGSHACPDAGRF